MRLKRLALCPVLRIVVCRSFGASGFSGSPAFLDCTWVSPVLCLFSFDQISIFFTLFVAACAVSSADASFLKFGLVLWAIPGLYCGVAVIALFGLTPCICVCLAHLVVVAHFVCTDYFMYSVCSEALDLDFGCGVFRCPGGERAGFARHCLGLVAVSWSRGFWQSGLFDVRFAIFLGLPGGLGWFLSRNFYMRFSFLLWVYCLDHGGPCGGRFVFMLLIGLSCLWIWVGLYIMDNNWDVPSCRFYMLAIAVVYLWERKRVSGCL